jgi:hypothetical protein
MPSIANGIDPAPIILMGLPRSGTTWIGKIFDSHPETLYLHEPDSAVFIKELPLIADSESESATRALSSALARTLNVRIARVVGVLPQFPKAYRTPPMDWAHRQLALGAKVCSGFIGDWSIPDLRVSDRPVRLVWKSIESLGRLGLIAHAMPNARIIHIMRHPAGWTSSLARGRRERRFLADDRNEWWSFDLLEATPAAKRRGLTRASFEPMSDLERDVWAWVLWNEQAMDASADLSNVMRIRYEDVCTAPLVEAQRMFKFAHLDWDRQTNEFVDQSTSTHKDQFYGVFRDPGTAANKWRKSISASDLTIIETILSESPIGRSYLASGSGSGNRGPFVSADPAGCGTREFKDAAER